MADPNKGDRQEAAKDGQGDKAGKDPKGRNKGRRKDPE